MNDIKKAVILAAGLGSRLRPLTEEIPKCLTEINGKVILEQSLGILERNGIQETVVVVGYLGNVVINNIGYKCGKMEIKYLWNTIYADTNSMYSAWLAREYLEQGAILIEGDTVFEEALITEVLKTPHNEAFWIGDRFNHKHRGSMSITDSRNRITEIRIVREELKEYKENYYKSTGIVKISPEYGKMFSKWLDDDVKNGNVQIYYDIVIGKHLNDAPIYVCDITGGRWSEIDTIDDLRNAERIFSQITI